MDTILNYPIRKFFVCELRYAVFNSNTNKWNLKIKGKTVPIVLIWLQGKINRTESYQDNNQYRFADSTGEAGLLLPSTDNQSFDANSYWRLFAEMEDVNTCDGSVILRAKKFTKLDDNEHNLSDLWCAEVVDYHKFLNETDTL